MAGPRRRYLSMAEETTYGGEVTTDSLHEYFDVESVGLGPKDGQALMDEGITSRDIQVVAPGPYYVEGDVARNLDANMLPMFLKWVLGQYYKLEKVECENDVFTHTFRPSNTLDSFTTRVGKDVFEHCFLGCKVNTLEISCNKGEFAKMTAGIIGKSDKENTLETNYTVDRTSYFNFAQCVITIPGSASIENFTLNINNNMSGDDGIQLGSRFPGFIEPSMRNIEYTADHTFDSVDMIEDVWGGTSPTTVDTFLVTITLTGSTITDTATAYTVVLILPALFYTGSSQPVSLRDRVVQSVSGNGKYDATAGYALQGAVTNAKEVYFDDFHVWGASAYSTDDIWIVGTQGDIYTSANGGTAITEQTSNITTRINDVHFVSADVGFAVGDSGVILKTVNAGVDWSSLTSGVTTQLNSVRMFSTTEGWAVGDGGVILITADGTSWTAQTSGVTTKLFGIALKDGTTAVCCGEDGVVLITANAGSTWTAKTSGVTEHLRSCDMIWDDPTLYFWCCGEDGVIITSADSGTNFTEQTSNVTEDLYGISFYDTDDGIAVGANGEIATTPDGGTNWTQDTYSDTTKMLYSVTMISATVAWAVGTFETVLKTTDAGDTWTLQTLT